MCAVVVVHGRALTGGMGAGCNATSCSACRATPPEGHTGEGSTASQFIRKRQGKAPELQRQQPFLEATRLELLQEVASAGIAPNETLQVVRKFLKGLLQSAWVTMRGSLDSRNPHKPAAKSMTSCNAWLITCP